MLLYVTLLAGCTTQLGSAPLLTRDVELVGTKLLRPGTSGRSCNTNVLGIPLADGAGTLDEAVARLFAQDVEGNVVTDVVMQEERMTTGLVNRRCFTVRGDLGRSITTITVPAGDGHPRHGTQ